MSVEGGAFVAIPSLCFAWNVDARCSVEGIHSPVFRFHSEDWELNYYYTNTTHFLDLVRKSEGCHPAFNISVLVEGGTGTEKRIVSELTETELITAYADYHGIWKKSDSKLRRSDPEFSRRRVLKFRLLMMSDDSYPLTVFPDASKSDASTQCKTVCHTTTSVQTPLHANQISCLEYLSDDLTNLSLDQDSGPDTEFQCAGYSTKAHGQIICARSPVIASMLSTDMVEGRTKIVRIPDMEPDVFQKFLRYLYSGKVEELTFESALCLYEAGDQYAVQGLAKRCSVFLKEHLTVQNACEVLVIADAHSDSEMVEAVVTYMLENKIPLVSDHWSAFSDAHPKLANKVLYHSYKLIN